MAAPSLIGRPTLLSSNSSTRRREPSFPSQTRGSSTGAWGAAAAPSSDRVVSGDLSSSGSRKKGGPSLSFAASAAAEQRKAGESIHPLKFNWDVWFSHRSAVKASKREDDKKDAPVKVAGAKEVVETHDWEHGLTNLGGFSSIESLHPFLAHLTTPSAFPASLHSSATLFSADSEGADVPSQSNFISEINVFRSPIQPSWEDAHNVGGGRWVLRLRKGVADRIWEEVVFALVGERLGGEEGTAEAQAGNKINGVVISVRRDEDILGLWCAPSTRTERDAIRDSLRTALEPLLGPAGAAALQLDYKPHPTSNNQQGGGPHTPGGGGHFGNSHGHGHTNGHHHSNNRRNHNGEQRSGGPERERSTDPERQAGSRRVAGFGSYASPRGARDQSRDGAVGEEGGRGFGERRAPGAGDARPRRGSGGERELPQRSSATAWGRS